MELGGKSPVYVSEQIPDNDMSVVADRIVWGKLLNAGQTCVAPDHVFCHENQMDHFCDEIIKSIKRMMMIKMNGNNNGNNDYDNNENTSNNKNGNTMDFDDNQLPRIVNEVHA